MKSCNDAYYETAAKNRGVSSALSELTLDILSDTTLASTCHSASHRIGHIAALHYGKLGSAFDAGSNICGNGFYHGVVEALFSDKELAGLSADDIRNICSATQLATTSLAAHVNCVHGVGHALMYMANGDISLSLQRCADNSSDSDTSQCATGVLMEEGFRIERSTSTDNMREDPTLFCSQTLGDQADCWLSRSAKEMAANDNGHANAEHFCEILKTPSYRAHCLSAIATQ